MAKLILGLAGEMGCGKGTAAEYVVGELKGSSHRFSTVIRDVLDRIYLEQTRENMQKLSEVLRKNFGEDMLAQIMAHDVQRDTHDVIVVDGVRRLSDIKYLKDFAHFKLVFIDTAIQKRYERITKRRENPDDRGKTFEQFQKEQEGEAEEQVKDLKNYADYVITNDEEFSDFYKQIDEIIKGNPK